MLGKGAEYIYNSGQTDKRLYDEQQQARKSEKPAPSRKGTGSYTNDTESNSDIEDVLKVLADVTGYDYETVSDKDTANGHIVHSLAKVVINEATGKEYQTAIHENLHYVAEYNPEDYKKLKNALLDWYKNSWSDDADKNTKFNKWKNEYKKAYNSDDNPMTSADIEEEMVADAISALFTTDEGVQQFAEYVAHKPQKEQNGIVQAFKDLVNKIVEQIKKALKRADLTTYQQDYLQMEQQQAEIIRSLFLEALDKASENYKSEQKNNTTTNSDVKFSINKNFASEYDNWDKKNPRKVFLIGRTSNALKDLGISEKKIYWDAKKIIKIKSDHVEMTDDIIKQVPKILESPIVVMKSKTKQGRITMFGEVYSNNKPILAVLELNPSDRSGFSLNAFKIASAYGKDNAQKFIDSSEIIYVSRNKKRVSEWEKRTRLQLPVGSSLTNSNINVSQSETDVNTHSMQNDTKYSLDIDDDYINAVNNDVKYSKKLGEFADVNINSQDELNYFDIKNTANTLNDYVGIQKSVLNKLKADNFFNENNRNIIVNADTDIVVEISPDGIRETLSKGGRYQTLPRKVKQAKIATIRSLPKLIKYAEVVELNQVNYHNNTDIPFLVLQHPVVVDDNHFDVEIKIKRSPLKNKFYIHNLSIKNEMNLTYGEDTKNSAATPLKSYGSSRDINVSQSETDVNNYSMQNDTKFSLDVSVEETKELVAIHNVREDKLIKALQLGGLPSPSIAIIKANQAGNLDFGDITLLFNKDTIDPELMKKNKVYSADAYTPTKVNIDNKLDEDKSNNLYMKAIDFENENKNIPFALSSVMLHPDNIRDRLNSADNIDKFIDNYINNYSMKQFFLGQSGKQITDYETKKEVSTVPMYKQLEYDYLIENYSNLIDKANDKDYGGDWWNDYGEQFVEARKEYYKLENPDITEEQLERKLGDDFGFRRAKRNVNIVKNIIKYQENGPETTSIVSDTQATKEKIDKQINQKDYEKWLHSLFDNIIEKQGIRNDKELFTPSGKHRSFEALHYEVTLENIVRAMNEQQSQGKAAFSNTLYGSVQTEYSSIDEIKKNSGRLQNIDQEAFDEQRSEFNSRLWEIAESMSRNGNTISVTDLLCEAVVYTKTKSGMASFIKREGEGWTNYNDAVVDDLINLVADMRKMPTQYFEAKPQRAVYFDEVVCAVVPDNVSSELKQALSDNNINYKEYAAGNKQERADVLNSFDDIKFSKNVDFKDAFEEKEWYTYREQKRKLELRNNYDYGDRDFIRILDENSEKIVCLEAFGIDGEIEPYRVYEVGVDYNIHDEDTFNRDVIETIIKLEREGYNENFTTKRLGTYQLYGRQTLFRRYDKSSIGFRVLRNGAWRKSKSNVGINTKSQNNGKRPSSVSGETRKESIDVDISDYKKVLRENKKLKELNQHLKEEFELTHGRKANMNSARILAKHLKESFDTNMTIDELAKEIVAMSNDFGSVENDTLRNWDDLFNASRKIAQKMYDNQKQGEIPEDIKSVLNDIRKPRISLSEMQKESVAYAYDSYHKFRQTNFGKVNYTNDGISLDTQWQEWAEIYPEFLRMLICVS